jgi:exonuclease SbcC
VCGATEHPRKAQKSAAAPTQAQVEAAEEKAAQAQKTANDESAKAAEKRGCVTSAESTLGEKLQRLAGIDRVIGAEEAMGLQITELEEQRTSLRTALTEAERLSRRKAALDREIPEKEREMETLRAQLDQARMALGTDTSRCDEWARQEQRLREKLRFDSRKDAVAELTALEEKIRALQSALQQAEEAWQRQKTEVERHRTSIAQLTKLLESGEEIDREAVTAEKDELSVRRTALSAQQKQVEHRLLTNEEAARNIRRKSEELGELDGRWTWMQNLSSTANGDIKGKEKVMLETYIQMTYFDRILRRANVHLMEMSGGQYDLKRRRNAENHRSQSGLELDVIDHYNGSERSVKTLSGGESFIASLSLALGLSEEVQASAGGILIDTMFVDEGFGSLDEDTLQQAMRALQSLTEGDRLVGVISHVAELRRAIDKQIVVTKAKSGGSTAVIRV